jgi:hypothetical protein
LYYYSIGPITLLYHDLYIDTLTNSLPCLVCSHPSAICRGISVSNPYINYSAQSHMLNAISDEFRHTQHCCGSFTVRLGPLRRTRVIPEAVLRTWLLLSFNLLSSMPTVPLLSKAENGSEVWNECTRTTG